MRLLSTLDFGDLHLHFFLIDLTEVHHFPYISMGYLVVSLICRYFISGFHFIDFCSLLFPISAFLFFIS